MILGVDCLQSAFSLEDSRVIIPSKRIRKKWRLNEKRLGRDKKRRTADSFAIFKPSASVATEQLIGRFIADDRSLTVQGASLFIFISLPNITFVWPPDWKNDFLFLLLKTTVHNKILIFEREYLFHPNHDSVSLWTLEFLVLTKEFWLTTQDNGNLTICFQQYCATGC